MKIVKVTKHFKRVYSDKAYGSIAAGTDITVEQEISTSEELQKLNNKLAKSVRVLTTQDLNEYMELKDQGMVL